MEAESANLPPTNQKVNMSTPPYINRSIQKKIDRSINYYRRQSSAEIKRRIQELDYEWDTERVLEANFAAVVLASSVLGWAKNKNWLLLSGVASIFMIQHAVQGWCPPLSVIRRIKVRTASEINEEKEDLRQLLRERGEL